MAQTLEERVAELEGRVVEVEERLEGKPKQTTPPKRGWRSFFGISANDPHFENAVRLGQEWRNADRPNDADEPHVPA